MPLAEFNFGTLRYPWDDPRLAEFQDNLDRVNALAARSPGFIWRLPDDEMEVAQEDPTGPLADRPNTASTLSVWADAASLWRFAYRTLHGHFLAKGQDWFKTGDRGHLVVWSIPDHHRPTVAEAMREWHLLQSEGETEVRFGATGLKARAAAA